MKAVKEKQTVLRERIKACTRKTCSIKTVKKRLPIVQWLPKYNVTFLVQDFIAGIAVGLTAILQGIAYAVIAGLSPEYGIYASLTSGFVYVVLGSCYNITVGPTAILAAMISKYVSDYSPDFALLAAFLSGAIQLLLGLLHLGFLVEFISQPVISGFTTAAALQIAAAQFKSFFGLAGSSGNYIAESVYNFILNIKTAKLWEPILSTATIVMLILLKKLGKGCKRTDNFVKATRWFISLARNAVVVIIGMVLAYILKVSTTSEPLALIGNIGKGLPPFEPPPFSTQVGNETLSFTEMLQILGPQSIMVMSFVAILEHIAIAKAFAGDIPIDATQELIALGMCNLVGSFAASMPITGSFTRTAINHASGVKTPAGGVSKCLLLIFALSVLAETFYFIPKASLAGLILVAMYYIIDLNIFLRLWKSSKIELLSLTVTVLVCLFYGLEYGIIVGILFDAVTLLLTSSRLKMKVETIACETREMITVPLFGRLSYCAVEHVRRVVTKAFLQASSETIIIVDGTNLYHIDSTVASNLLVVVKEMAKKVEKVLFYNFNNEVRNMCLTIDKNCCEMFVSGHNAMEVIESIFNNV